MRWRFARQRSEGAELVEPQAAYALWAATYPPYPHNRLMEVEQQTVLSLLPDLRGLTALDAGCGTGRYARELSLRGASVIGVDLSAAMLTHARSATRHLARGDVCALPIASGSIDVAVCGLALGDVRQLDEALAELSRVLKPGGSLTYSVVHPAGAEAGWLRTFEAEGRRMAIDTHWHSGTVHRHACAAAGLAITAWAEPVLHESPEFPAVLVIRAAR